MKRSVIRKIQGVGSVVFERSYKAKHLNISIRPFKGIRVAVPVGCSFKKAERFVQSKIEWIKRHQKKIKEAELENESILKNSYEINRSEARKILVSRLNELAEKNGFEFGRVFIRCQKTLWEYMIRPILSLKRLSFDEGQGQVIYQYGKYSTESEHMDYLEFIARVTSHIPDKGQVMIRYYGLYANAHRGKMRKTGADVFHVPIIEDMDRYVPSKGWAEMIRKVYEVDPQFCPACGGKMSIIAFIADHKIIDKIIAHLKLTFKVKFLRRER